MFTFQQTFFAQTLNFSFTPLGNLSQMCQNIQSTLYMKYSFLIWTLQNEISLSFCCLIFEINITNLRSVLKRDMNNW